MVSRSFNKATFGHFKVIPTTGQPNQRCPEIGLYIAFASCRIEEGNAGHFYLKVKQVLNGQCISKYSNLWVDSSKHLNDAENLMLLNNVETFIK